MVMGHEYGYGDHGSWGSGVLMMLVVTLVVAAVVWLIAVALRAPGPATPLPPIPREDRRTRSAAEAMLDERYARGEIDEDEYRRRREVLEHACRT